jgi:hypothetical protein
LELLKFIDTTSNSAGMCLEHAQKQKTERKNFILFNNWEDSI